MLSAENNVTLSSYSSALSSADGQKPALTPSRVFARRAATIPYPPGGKPSTETQNTLHAAALWD